jgi:hypothetical protein
MNESNDMTCAELAEVTAELALGVLTGRERAMAVAHLDECDACREDVRQLMATSEQLLELLPPAEPPAGFETRVLDRLGLPAPALGHAELLRVPARASRPRRPAWGGRRPGTSPSGALPAGPGRRRRVSRALAAVATGVAVIVAGLGGWGIGAATSPASAPRAPLTSASLLSATDQEVGSVFLYSGEQRWLYMSVDLGAGSEPVTCQLIGTDGKLTTLGTFQLTGGYGGWGTPDPDNTGTLRGAQLLSSDGTVLATATFAHW